MNLIESKKEICIKRKKEREEKKRKQILWRFNVLANWNLFAKQYTANIC